MDIQAELDKIGHTLKTRHNMELYGDNVDGVSVGIEIEETWTGSGFMNSRRTGKYRVRVGTLYGSVRPVGFRELKGGGFSYDKIADKLVDMRAASVAAQERAKKKQMKMADNETIREGICTKLNVYKHHQCLSVAYQSGFDQGALSFKVTDVSPDHAEKFMALAIELGIIKQLGV